MSEAPYKIHRGMRGDEVIDAVERMAYVRADKHAELQSDAATLRTTLDDAMRRIAWLEAENERLKLERGIAIDTGKQLQAQVLALQSCQMAWRNPDTRSEAGEVHLVCNAIGQVAPCIRGVIYNTVGTAHDWRYGEAVTGWMPLPAPLSEISNG